MKKDMYGRRKEIQHKEKKNADSPDLKSWYQEI